MERIESTQNKQVKEWKKLLTRKGRKKQNRYLVEGLHLVEEAMKSDAEIDVLVIREDKVTDYAYLYEEREIDAVEVTEEISSMLSDAVTEQGVLAVIKSQESPESLRGDKPVLMLDEVQDPGNLGTLIRTADAAGFEGVIIGKGSVDLFNPKALRSAQGSHFHLSIIHDDIETWISVFKDRGIPVYGTALDERAVSYRSIEPQEKFALIVGNEGNGVNPQILEQTDENLYIPIKGQAESLNVAIAASILMFSLYH
ncbi:RNA methyltransferase, TrmH family [Alkalibacterium subtropicum]|uniref:RNA methyltransferase, TrmH family n=1 Tax=Alkalibacterium subtropicum TaxID=753702 RepID=A0A1I1H1D1_9LACT|nr:RNA methyltransferase [Alkalibacterium subtropicum]SFC15213.1 RNA methyltransferase, TrmH family [Alkalibacterium subtropicum]